MTLPMIVPAAPTRASVLAKATRSSPVDDFALLIVPGLGGSGPRHWQSAWQRRAPGWARVEQDDWDQRDVDAWARRIVETALPLQRPVVLIAHSFGCLAAVRAADFQSNLIAGALLVAPADPARFGLEQRLPRNLLAYPTTLVLSQTDPWMTAATARDWASRWGSAVVDLGSAGHINVEAGYTDWPEGLDLLSSLCRRIPSRLSPAGRATRQNPRCQPLVRNINRIAQPD